MSSESQPDNGSKKVDDETTAIESDWEQPDTISEGNICKTCLAIPFEDLPMENEPALPHKSSLSALRKSALTCMLCRLLLHSVNDIRDDIDPRRKKAKERSSFLTFSRAPLDENRERSEIYVGGSFLPGSNVHTSPSAPGEPLPFSEAPNHTFAQDDLVRPFLFGNWWNRDPDYPPDKLVGLGIRIGSSSAIEDAEGNSRDFKVDGGDFEGHVHYRGTLLRIRVNDDSPLAHKVIGRFRAADSSSSIAFDRIRNWLKECDSMHRCVELNPQLPTRILDLGLEPEIHHIRLIEGNGKRGAYVALSHRWGTSHRITLTRETVEPMKAGIPLTALPQTFRDAALITKEIGLRFLWIDSLCIMQDDLSDWESEAPRMADVYMNSYVTIAASASEDDSSGVFPAWKARSNHPAVSSDSLSLARKPMFVNPAPMIHPNTEGRMSYCSVGGFALLTGSKASPQSEICISVEWMPSSTTSNPRLYAIPAFGRPVDQPATNPLNSRLWVLQERLLSPRTLHYCVDQIYWECNNCLIAEDGSRAVQKTSNFGQVARLQQLPPEKHGICGGGPSISFIEGLPSNDVGTVGRWDGGWLSLIQDYTRRQFTHSADKLTALSGLATALSRTTGDEYYAGLWRDHILEDLFWRVYTREERRFQVPGCFAHWVGRQLCTPKRPTAWRAPSWSWASIDAWIIFVPLDFNRLLTKFINAEVTPAGQDTFGRLSGGQIRLKGRLKQIIRASSSFEPDPKDPLGFGIFCELHLPHGISYGEAFFDLEVKLPCSALFFDTSNALLLTPSKTDSSRWMRIGIAKFLRTDYQRKTEPIVSGNPPKINQVPYGPMTSEEEIHEVVVV